MSAMAEGNPRIQCAKTGERYCIHAGTSDRFECPGCGRKHRL